MKSFLTIQPLLTLKTLQIILLQYSSDAAFLHNPALLIPSTTRTLSSCRENRRRQRYKEEISTLSLSLSAAEPSIAPSTSSSSSTTESILESMPVTTRQSQQRQQPRRRHPLFQNTNAISKSMPIPHPDLWRSFLPSYEESQHVDSTGTSSSGGDNNNDDSFWNAAKSFLLLPQNKPMGKNQHVRTPMNDVQVQFTDPAIGARQLLEQCGIIGLHSSSSQNSNEATTATTTTSPSSSTLPLPETIMAETETLNHITQVLAYFQTIAAPNPTIPTNNNNNDDNNNNSYPTTNNNNVECTARIVSTMGSTGTKCPRWHADHVPVRLIMSVLGPGCEYIPETIHEHDNDQRRRRVVNRMALNNLEEGDTRIANDVIVPPALLSEAEGASSGVQDEGGTAIVQRAVEGEAVLLMGRAWEEERDDDDDDDDDDSTPTTTLSSSVSGRNMNDVAAAADARVEWEGAVVSDNVVLAAVHRSPTLEPEQERILLTVDLIDWN